jgi:hypothetical protein
MRMDDGGVPPLVTECHPEVWAPATCNSMMISYG